MRPRSGKDQPAASQRCRGGHAGRGLRGIRPSQAHASVRRARTRRAAALDSGAFPRRTDRQALPGDSRGMPSAQGAPPPGQRLSRRGRPCAPASSAGRGSSEPLAAAMPGTPACVSSSMSSRPRAVEPVKSGVRWVGTNGASFSERVNNVIKGRAGPHGVAGLFRVG